MTITEGLAPAGVWRHFEALSAIPRVSGNEKGLADHILAFAKAQGLEARQDAAGNVLVLKPASRGLEGRVPVVLQSHLDMVGQKAAGSAHDFSKDPLRLVREGDWLRAEGTTLGADNGVGVAASLAVLEDAGLRHGPLSALFTVEEEIGLRGAAKVGEDFLRGGFLINLDADAPDELIIGCAGALDLRAVYPCKQDACPASWTGLEVTLTGLQGGHSGADIHRGRGNAPRLLARLLSGLEESVDCRLATMAGGDARNAIPREARAVLGISPEVFHEVEKLLGAACVVLAEELRLAEPGLRLELLRTQPPSRVVNWHSSQALYSLIRACPNGVIRLSDVQPGVVETSSNLGILELGADGQARMQFLLRSLVDSAKQDLAETTLGLLKLAGAQTEVYGDYPGWTPRLESRLLPLFAARCEKVLGTKPRIVVVHGGLECGILKAVNPLLDCISVGPIIQEMHCPRERLQVSSVEAFYRILTGVLEDIPAA